MANKLWLIVAILNFIKIPIDVFCKEYRCAFHSFLIGILCLNIYELKNKEK